MNILITNDDGINSIGIKTIAKQFTKLGNVYVIAPDSEKSCSSHSVNISGKIRIEKIDYVENTIAYKLYSGPADCIKIGLRSFLDVKFDLVVSGINTFANTGSDIIYSATVAGAREAFMNNIPSIGVALYEDKEEYYEDAAKFALDIAKKYLNDPLNKEYFLNINYPTSHDVKDVVVCDKLSKRDYGEQYELKNIDGIDYVVVTGVKIKDEYEEGNNRYELVALKNNHPTITAVRTNQLHDEYTTHLEKVYL